MERGIEMPMVNPSTSNAPVIADDIYMVECLGVTERTLQQADAYGKTEKYAVHLAVYTLDGERVMDEETGDEVQIDPLMNRAWSEKATLFKYAIAFGIDADPDKPFDTERLNGKRAQASIQTEKVGAWPKVAALMPLPKGKAASVPAQRPTDPPEVGSVVNADGSCNWARFWMELSKHGLNESHVIAHAGDAYGAIDGPDAQVVLTELVAIANG